MVVPSLVSPVQSAFIKGRSIHDNILLAQEIAHSMYGSKGKNPYIMIKGIRQGDPLSPYLYVLIAQSLSCLLDKAVELGKLQPFKVKNKVKISHLMFADDVLLTFRATRKSLNTIKEVFRTYENFSGQSINFSKSEIFFPKAASREQINFTRSSFNMQVGSFPFKYLGTMVAPRRPPANAQNFILDQMKAKLSAWKVNFLSQVGRVVLVNSVLNAIPLHSLSVSWVSHKFIDSLEKIIRKFLWASSFGNAIHLLAWDVITKLKAFGGLGIADLIDKCLALQAKRVLGYLN
ncbi:hypothetical protein Cni_G13107 [Canna indica]|uniref:Reverse transcriptase domain-containing protein n=1 Tax=Canna indica TaxID=4628 RepID=A0AAQ3Q9K8_9LILI|nr:hypothetical protein Cni_G13107 [Canna indica]